MILFEFSNLVQFTKSFAIFPQTQEGRCRKSPGKQFVITNAVYLFSMYFFFLFNLSSLRQFSKRARAKTRYANFSKVCKIFIPPADFWVGVCVFFEDKQSIIWPTSSASSAYHGLHKRCPFFLFGERCEKLNGKDGSKVSKYAKYTPHSSLCDWLLSALSNFTVCKR